MARIFLSYARADETQVRGVYRRLLDAGFEVWMDKINLLPGQRWEQEIPRAIRNSDFILIFFSKNSVARRGYIQREFRLALETLQEMPADAIHTIPIRLDDCQIPEQFRPLQWSDLSEVGEFDRIVRALRLGMEQRQTGAPEPALEPPPEPRPDRDRPFSGAEGPSGADASVYPAREPEPAKKPLVPDQTPRRVSVVTIVGLVIAAVSVLAAVIMVPDVREWLGNGPPVDRPRLSIAVLPFSNLSGDPGQEYFSDGLTEDLTTDLSSIEGAFVIARNTMQSYRSKTVDIKQLGRELGVRYILEGSVRRADSQVRVNAQLIDAETGAHIWAERFDRGAEDLFSLQTEVTGQIARTLHLQVKKAESQRTTRGRPENLEAIDYARKAWAELWNKPPARETNDQAFAYLEKALALDPQVPEIWTNLSYAHTHAAVAGWSTSRSGSLQLARVAGERAVALDPQSADAHYVLGFAIRAQGDIDRALEENETAVTLNPNHTQGHAGIGICWIMRGRPREALPYFDHAFRLSPRDPLRAGWHTWVGLAHMMLGDDRKALEQGKRSAAANPKSDGAFTLQAAALALLGRQDEARAALAVRQQIGPPLTISTIKEGSPSDYPKYRQLMERYYKGLRQAGLPE